MATDLTVKRYTTLEVKRRELEAELEGVNKEMSELEQGVLEYMGEMGFSNMKFDTLGLTLFIKRVVRAQVQTEDRQTVAEILKNLGYGAMIKEDFNLNSLSALVREFEGQGEPLPEELRPYVAPVEQFTASFRKA